MYDICIIGGGAAGLISAVIAKETNPSLRIAVTERLDRFGKKLSLTGNGRCNITNRHIETENYHGRQPQFTESFFARFGLCETMRFFEKIGVPVVFEGDKAYPRSLQAASVTDALRFRIEELDVETLFGCEIKDIEKRHDCFELKSDGKVLNAKAVIVACGLCSGGARLGCDGAMLETLKRRGLQTVPVSPAVVQIKTNTEHAKQLKGIKTNAAVSLLINGKSTRRESGEVLFCEYGLSGPPILQLSGHCTEGCTISLDLMPDTDFSSLLHMLKSRQKNLKHRHCDEFLSGLINKRLGQVILKRAGVRLDSGVSEISNSLEQICKIIKAFTFEYRGTTGFSNSQVTKGGLATSQFDRNLMCKKIKGLFAAGEILDIDGDCGGYNLQWAWSSGCIAARGAAEYLR